MGPLANDWCPHKKRGHRHREEGDGDGDGDCSEASPAKKHQGAPSIARSQLKLCRSKEGSLPGVSKGAMEDREIRL